MLVPTLPLYALHFTDSFSLASLVVSAAGFGTVIADVPWGWLGLQAPFYGTAALAAAAAVVSFIFIREGGPAVRRSRKMRWTILAQLARSHWRELIAAGSAQVFAQMIRQGRQIVVPLYGAS